MQSTALPAWVYSFDPFDNTVTNLVDDIVPCRKLYLSDIKHDLALFEKRSANKLIHVKANPMYNNLLYSTENLLSPKHRRDICQASKRSLSKLAMALNILQKANDDFRCRVMSITKQRQGNTTGQHRGIGHRECTDDLAPLFADSTNEDYWPSRAVTEKCFINRINNLQVMRFTEVVDIIKEGGIPDAKQCAKDLLRDSVRINGDLIEGSLGYDSLVRYLSNVIKAHNTTCTDEAVHDHSKSTSNSSDDTDDEFYYVLAMTLVHIVSRTFTGGICLEKVLNVFSSDEFGVCVPDSRYARPSDIIVSQNGVVSVYSQLRYRLHQSDLSEQLYAVVDVFFVTIINMKAFCEAETIQLLRQRLIDGFSNNTSRYGNDNQNLDTVGTQIQIQIFVSGMPQNSIDKFVDASIASDVNNISPLKLLLLAAGNSKNMAIGLLEQD